MDCVVIGIINVPRDPVTETRPSTCCAAPPAARATAVITNDGAVHDKATPISAPDKIKTSPRQRLP